MKNSEHSLVLGLMSGTSLDGLDLALCRFNTSRGKTKFKILKAKTIAYTPSLKQKLSTANHLTALDYATLHAFYGRWMGQKVNQFLSGTSLRPDAIASHGHTVFHQPRLGFSTQLGCGATLAAVTGITTVCDFRTTDTALGGQGAPLVPIGDKGLFSDYQACLNIGGIANISFEENGKRLAFDICAANMLLNYLSAKKGLSFDKNGRIAAAGKVNPELLRQLNQLPFFQKKGARSLGREWFESDLLPLIEKSSCSLPDLMATSVLHIAMQIDKILKHHRIRSLLITGGGAFNTQLMVQLKALSDCKIQVPDKETVSFKESLIFAFLGHLRLNQKVNTLASVTGASRNSCGGAVYLGNRLK